MGKWLAIGAAVLGIALVLLWRSVRSEPAPAREPTPSPPVAAPRAAPVTPTAPRPTPNLPEHPDLSSQPVAVFEKDEIDQDAPFVADSDEFYAQIDEVFGRRLRGYAAPCYQGGHQRKGKVRLLFTWNIKGGEVRVANVRVDESTLADPALEECMRAAVAAAHWKDARMPDWATHPGEDERLLIRIDGLKRYAKDGE